MKVLILGATGATGSLSATAAVRAGHDVTVLVRDPSRLTITGVTAVTGDATNSADVEKALQGQDALISALGSRKQINLASTAARNFVPAAEKFGLSKVIVMSAWGVGSSRAQSSGAQRLMFSLFLTKMFADKAVADDQLRASGLDYTLVYPVTLSNKPATGSPTVGESLPMKGMPSVPRADVADVLVAALANDKWSRKTIAVSA